MNYDATVAYLYAQLPFFQKIGEKAIKPKLDNIISLCNLLGNPQENFKCIHVAGTNGKGSSSHFLASILMESGYKVGLYTSPHLKDFRERFRINGKMIHKNAITSFVRKHKAFIENLQPSFFEVSVAMAFQFFKEEKIDVAVIEVGLGGKYDSTNIINPILSLITNIGFDHMNVLGNTIPEIAWQKAGIIKKNTPVVISEYNIESRPVFDKLAAKSTAPITYAFERYKIVDELEKMNGLELNILNVTDHLPIKIKSQLSGIYQENNVLGVLTCIDELCKLGFEINDKNLKAGFSKVVTNTQLKGRWQKLNSKPLVICDTGHNEHALAITIKKIVESKFKQKYFILGFVNDKDVDSVIKILPKDAIYGFCTFDSFRALKAFELKTVALKHNLNFEIFDNVNAAIENFKTKAQNEDIIFVGGSTYLVAEIDNL